MTVYFVQTGHAQAGPDLRRHLTKRYSSCRLSEQTLLIATEEPAAAVARGLIGVAGKPRGVENASGRTCLDWTMLVVALAGPWAGTLGSTAAKWVSRCLPVTTRSARPAVFVAHWDAPGPPWDRRDRPDGYFRSRFRDWVCPAFNTFLLRTRLGPDTLLAGIRNKWRGAPRRTRGREMAFVGELAGDYVAYLDGALPAWLAARLRF